MNFEMDLFDWSQLPGQFEHEDISGGLGDVLATDNFAAATLGWTDYFSTPNVSMMTYPEARRMLNERQQSLIQTPALTRNSGSSFSTNESCQCDDGNEGSQKDLADEDEDEDETVAPRSGGRPRTPLHNGRDPVLNRIQVSVGRDAGTFAADSSAEASNSKPELAAHLSAEANGRASEVRRESHRC